MFCTIWVHSGPFGCLTKLCGKRGELVQRFVPRSRVGFFRNERVRSTPFNRKLTFWYVSFHLGAFRTIWLPYETLWKTEARATKSRWNFSQRFRPIHPIGPQTNVLVRFVPFGYIRDHLVALRKSVRNGPN